VLPLARLEDRPRHGYAVKEALRSGAGLVTGSRSAVDARRWRTYRLTAAGQRRLHGDRGARRDFAGAITAVVERKPGPADELADGLDGTWSHHLDAGDR
jgi:hypothetical protein